MYTHEKVSTFQERFASLMKESGKNSIELSKALHVSNQTISAWKLGTRSPKEPTVIAIASFFKVSVQWLLGFDVQKEPVNMADRPIIVPDSERFVKLVRYMSQDDYIMVMEAFLRAEKKLKEAEGAM